MNPVQVLGHFHGNAKVRAEERVETVKPEHLALENLAEVARQSMGNILHRDFAAEFLLHGGDRFRRDSTRNDEIKKAQVSIYIQRDAMRGDSTRNVDAESCNFGFAQKTPRLLKAIREQIVLLRSG